MSTGPVPARGTAGSGVEAGEAALRSAIDDLANQLCVAVDGDFDFAVRSSSEDVTLEKLSMLINFVLDTARRGMSALQQHNQALSQLDMAKTVFFSNASHELRTPLTLILGPIEDALGSPHGALSGDVLTTAHRNAVRLLKLVNALLDFSRIEAGRLQAAFQPADLARLTRELASVFQSAIDRAGLTLEIDCPPLPEPVYVDPEMWEKIVLNLLSNAFKFTFAGGIFVGLRIADEHVELEVRDTGTGIPPHELPHIFERFHRVEGARARTHEGFGIGLAMIHELVRIHGGSIRVSSVVEQGTMFTVALRRGHAHLPADRIVSNATGGAGQTSKAFIEEARSWLSADGQIPASPDTESATEGRAIVDNARILVADDNADMRAYITRLLGRHWTVESTSDGAAALEAALKQPPDIVVSDVMMPNLSGHQLVRALREDARTSSVPILLLSARAGEEALIEGLEAGADDYLVKPFSGRELIARVQTHLQLSRLRTDAAAIQRIGALLNSQLDLQRVVQTLTDEATRLSGAEFGAFFYNVVDDAGERYMLYTLAGAPREAFSNFPLPRNTDLFQPTFNGECVVRLDDVTRDPRYGKTAPYFGMPKGHLPVRSYLAVPVISKGGEVLGGLFFGHSRPGMFSERHEQLIAAVANHAAIAIDNAHLYKSEKRARAEAESATRAKDEFLAMLGHELRNPLSPIVTALQIMEQQGDSSTERERAVLQRQVNHLVRLVDDLLDVSRITGAKIELKNEPLELGQAVTKGIEIASPLLEQRRHKLHLSVPHHGLQVLGDLVRLAQVISNLLTNAAKYTEPEGEVTVTAGREGGEVVLRVRDNGIGIAPENLARVFDLFAQAPQSLARSEGGLGLGLTIVRSLVAMHGGSVEAHSDGPGHGSEFVVRLPHYTGPARTSPAVEPKPATVSITGALRILLVDDNLDAAELLAEALSMLGHTVRVAHDGPSALREASAFRPHVALLDIGLPVMDGYEVAQRLRALPDISPIHMVAVTGYGQEGDRERSSAAGFEGHLVKPVDIPALVSLIEHLADRA